MVEITNDQRRGLLDELIEGALDSFQEMWPEGKRDDFMAYMIGYLGVRDDLAKRIRELPR